MTECYCDYDESPTIYEASVRRARLRHKCYECGGAIHPGDRYESARMLFEGSWRVDKTCARCLANKEDLTHGMPKVRLQDCVRVR